MEKKDLLGLAGEKLTASNQKQLLFNVISGAFDLDQAGQEVVTQVEGEEILSQGLSGLVVTANVLRVNRKLVIQAAKLGQDFSNEWNKINQNP